jgi:hypothetical protein
MTTTTLTPRMLVLDYDNTGRGTGRVAVPAGRYYLGDPCYPFPNTGPNEGLWMELLRRAAFFYDMSPEDRQAHDVPDEATGGPVASITVDGETFEVLSFGTQYGDGGYFDQHRHEYSVDAGMIGLLPMALVEKVADYTPERLAELGNVVTFETGVLCERDADGTLTFGSYVIETGDAADEDETDDYDEDEDD